MRISVVLLEFGASRTRLLHTSTAGISKWLGFRNYSFCLIPEQLAGWLFGEKKPHKHSDLINQVDSVEFQQSRCGGKATRSVARLDVIAFSRSPGLVLNA
jgi:hypothetical protein